MDNGTYRGNGLLNENLCARQGISSHVLLVREAPVAPKTTRLLPLFLVAKTVNDKLRGSKTLLLKIALIWMPDIKKSVSTDQETLSDGHFP